MPVNAYQGVQSSTVFIRRVLLVKNLGQAAAPILGAFSLMLTQSRNRTKISELGCVAKRC